MNNDYIVVQARGKTIDDPRKLQISDPLDMKYLLFKGDFPNTIFLGIFGSIRQLNEFVTSDLAASNAEGKNS